MLNFKKGASLLLVLFALCSCSSEKGKVTTKKDSENTINSEQRNNTSQIVVEDGNPEAAYIHLKELANKEFIEIKNLNTNTMCIENLVSFESKNNIVSYGAIGGYNGSLYFIKVNMHYYFTEEDEFIYKMTNLNLNSAVATYGVSAEVMELTLNENLYNKFDDKIFDTFVQYNDNEASVKAAYIEGDNTYFALTYIGSDSYIHSINELRYNDVIDSFEFTSEYKIKPNTKMYTLLGMLFL